MTWAASTGSTPEVPTTSERVLAVTESQKSDDTAATEAAPVPSPAAFAAKPRPVVPAPSAPSAAAAAPAAAPAPTVPAVSVAEASKWGRVEGDGHVFLTIDGEEHPVGQYPGVSADEALAYFARKFEDVLAQISLAEQRVSSHAPVADVRKAAVHARAQLAERAMVGDLRAAEARLDALEASLAEAEDAEKAQHEAARVHELERREAIVAEAEQISGQDPERTQWKSSGARMNELFEEWKNSQKSGLRLGRAAEDTLWKRFRAARTQFDRHRRAYFSQLDSVNAQAKSVKEGLIAEAETLQSSTEWGWAAGEYRRLMDEWKAAPRASRKDDDALWVRFRAAQNVFFEARQAANDAVDREYSANLSVKEALLEEAQRILPVKDLAAAKKALQSVRERWEDAGRVPRADMGRIEAGLRKVEDAVAQADHENWRRTDPETKARTDSALSQLESSIAGLEDDLSAAKAKGDRRAEAKAQEALDARRAWLETLRQSANELG
ncbi:DUF349 domain-containing protein [Sinomonas puerhi]|uniref:DUF349 domain-containing protein n=1 Tax=Sinomonas puerhi TaxID=3238584 RepID=UPI003C12C86C